MPGTTAPQEIEMIREDMGGGGGKQPPASGDGGGDKERRGGKGAASPSRYYTGLGVAIVSILMFFMALASAYLVRKSSRGDWVPVHLPALLWLNTAILLSSSGTIELARRRLATSDLSGFRTLWHVTTGLGVLFLAGQVLAWLQLVAQGVFLASNPASSFFYIITGAHALHLIGGVGALCYVAIRNFEETNVSRSTAAEITSYYWHFMDGLWIFLLALLYLGG
jgi:cytochrome c oxidase subunit 3